VIFSSNYSIKLKRLIVKFRDSGFKSLLFEISEYLSYHLNEKWEFVYFELSVEDFSFINPKADSRIEVKKATQSDIKKIENDLYPHFTHKQDFDKKYISQIGEHGINCFIASIDNQIVHYFMLFENALDSPLMVTPFKENLAQRNDAYLGNAFTIPQTRGYWILPMVLSEIFSHLKTKKDIKRTILLVHTDTPSATDFFQKIGFKIIEGAARQPVLIRIFRTILEIIYYFKDALYQILPPFVEPIILRLNQGISIDHHTMLCEEIERYYEKDIQINKESQNSAFEKLLISESEDEKKELELKTIQKIAAKLPLNNKKSITRMPKKPLLDFLNSRQDDHSLHRLIFLVFENVSLDKQSILKLNDILIKNVPIDEWAAPKQIVFERSFLLMSLLASYRLLPNHSVKEYLEKASERLLRVFEIKQQSIINFSESPNDKIESLIEQLRLIYFFLLLSDTFDDKRFLNAALKANDRVLSLVKTLNSERSKNLENILVFSYYRHNIQLQESQMRNLI
tara:strand:- start:17506 stop:19038 length:1533 start_codon:yes stop_codon:yes gene_type:complete